MFASRLRVPGTLAVTFLLVMAAGCNSDDPVTPEPAGSIVVNPSPDVLDAPWSLVGPESYAAAGTGDQTLNDLVPGTYTITWQEVADWVAPADETATLADGAVVTFTGAYTSHSGLVVIDTEPDDIDAPWQITGPLGYFGSGNGDAVLTSMVSGSYTVTWGDVAAWVAPAAATLELTADEMAVFSGVYTPAPGTVIVDCTPDDIGAPWTLTGPAGYSHAGQGDATLADLAVGDYEVQWGPVEGWVRPAGAAATLGSDETITFTGTYQTPPPYPFPVTENQVMQNLVAIHEAMDVVHYRELIHPDYQMLLQPATQEQFPDLGPTIDQDEELRITERMFSGEAVTDPDGQLVPGVGGIAFQLFEQTGPWEQSSASDVFPNARYALFETTILFDRPGNSTLRVEGLAKFYVAGRDSVYDGENRTYWQIVGLQDLTNGGGKAVEQTSWGTVKGLFR